MRNRLPFVSLLVDFASMSLDADILNDFYKESNIIIAESIDLLEEIEGDFSQKEKLKVFANKVDRLMGASSSLALIKKIELPMVQLKHAISSNFIERLRWISEQFSKQNSLKTQNEIDALMKKMGF